MKKVLVLAAFAALVAVPAMAAVVGTKHDLSSTGGTTGFDTNATEVCVFCHTPHGANMSATKYTPLWNRTYAVDPTAFYSSTVSLNSAPSLAATVSTDAYLCLSCHDGVTLTGALTNPPNATGAPTNSIALTGQAALGTDLSNDHPIGMDYAATALLDSELKAGAALPFFGGEMWCSSCHDVHSATNAPFLQASNVNSALCLTCHNK